MTLQSKVLWLLSPLAALLFVSAIGTASGQSIFTVAGGGTDDGRPANAVGLQFPSAVALDRLGNLYIADSVGNRIRKVAAGSGIITTVAGTGASGTSGDGGPATAASLSYPEDVAVDTLGNLYIADSFNHRVRKITAATGIITTIVGTGEKGFSGDGGPPTNALLDAPSGIAIAPSGDFYVADAGNNRIRKVANGLITTIAGTGSPGYSGDGGPATKAEIFTYARDSSTAISRVALDNSQNLYISDYFSHRVRKISADSGLISTIAGSGPIGLLAGGYSGDGGPATTAQLHGPMGLKVDGNGNLYVVDGFNSRIRKVAVGSGIITTVAGGGLSRSSSSDGGPATAAALVDPWGLAIDPSGHLYIADAGDHRIRKVAPESGVISTVAGNGSVEVFGDGGPATAAGLFGPRAVASDASGNLVIADSSANRIRRVAAGTGIISTIVGTGSPGFSGDGGPATAAQLYSPEGVVFDRSGDLLIADNNNHRVRKVSAATGTISTVAGNGAGGGPNFGDFSGDGGPATAAALFWPYGLAIDASGNLYIADYGNKRVRKVSASTGVISTVAGSGSGALAGDGGPATSAGLNPISLAVDAIGNVYVADLLNYRIRKVRASDGRISSLDGVYYSFGIALDPSSNIYVAESATNRVIRIDAATGASSPVAGNYIAGFSGDGGAATVATLSAPLGVAFDPSGSLYIATGDRVRKVSPCRVVTAATVLQPANQSSSVVASPRLSWMATAGAFHYDVYLDTVNQPKKVIAADVASPSYSPSNLEPLTTYYWKVVTNGDPFCTPFSQVSSDVWSFTTTGSCSAPGAFDANPAN